MHLATPPSNLPARVERPRALLLTAVAYLLFVLPALAQPTTQEITLERIMAHPEWLGRAPENPYWAADSESFYYFRDEPAGDDFDPREQELFEANLDGEVLRTISPEERASADVERGELDLELEHQVYELDGDIYWRDLESGEIRQLTRTGDRESSPYFLTDGRIGYQRDRKPYARDLETGLETQLFDLRLEKDPLEKLREEEDSDDYLEQQQDRLFDWIQDEDARSEDALKRRRDEQQRNPARAPLPFYLGSDRELGRVAPSPSGQHLLATTTPKRKEPAKRERMPQYVTGSGYVDVRDVRSKVGEAPRQATTLWLFDAETHELKEIDLAELPEITVDPLAELRAAAEALKKARHASRDAESDDEDRDGSTTEDADDSDEQSDDGSTEEFGDEAAEDGNDEAEDHGREADEPRPVSIGNISWNRTGDRALVDVYSLDNKDRWLVVVDTDGDLGPVHHMHDEAWINWRFRTAGWLLDDRHVYFQSEESGWGQLYRLDATQATAVPERLTQGDFVVDSPSPSLDGRYLYYTAAPDHPGNFEIYRVPVGGGDSEQITDLGGLNEFELSPDGERLLILHSEATQPPDLWIQPAQPGGQARRVTQTVSDEFEALPWVEPQIVEVPSSHVGRPIYSRLYLPTSDRGIDDEGKRPAVMFVHGAGYLQNAHLGWSGYFREFMFHSLLAQHGYVVLDMDYRASAGYGRDWRTAIYRQMGTPEVEDLEDGVRFLVEEHGVDPERVGVYGGSYGGFLTFMAMFTKPQLFAAGAALRPVTDWAHYNHGYTSNILNTPEIDPEAYERSSPIEYAEGLENPLLIATGMLDDNVFFMDSVRLVQKLIELEKEDWEIAIYPVEPHGFIEPSSWLDEYRRIFKLFERHLKE